MKRRELAGGVAVALAALSACRSAGGSPRGAAEHFLDEHYVRIDLKAAKAYASGVALQKVEEEQRLVGDQQIDASTRRPTVSYTLAEERTEGEDRATLIYDGKVRFDDGDTVELRWVLNTRREADGGWKVSNYQEFQ